MVIDVTHAHFWDITAVAALDKVVERLRHHGLYGAGGGPGTRPARC